MADAIPDYLKRVIFDLLHYRRSTIRETAWFKKQRHNQHLCPRLELQIETILNLFDRYHRTVHDIQGLRDRGVDVMLKYAPKEDAESDLFRFIGFQVKSYPEVGQPGWITKLKAQCWEASERDLEDYYVLFCTDVVEHKKYLNDAYAELVAQKGVTIIAPELAYTFLQLQEHQLAAYIKSKLSRDDAVYRAAVDSLDELTPTQAAIVIELLARHLMDGAMDTTVADLRDAAFVQHMYEICPDVNPELYLFGRDSGGRFLSRKSKGRSYDERFQEDYTRLEGGQVETSSWSDRTRASLEEFRAIEALMLDASVRYGYEGEELRAYILHALMHESLGRAAEIAGTQSARGV